MISLTKVGTIGLLLGFAQPAGAADFSDPTWPCIQRKVENLSLGLMWPHPVPEDTAPNAKLRDLAAALSLRRIGLEDAETRIAALESGDAATLGQVFTLVFDQVSRERRDIITGIGRYSQKQIALAERIDETRVRMSTLMAAAEPDFDTVDKLEEQLDWDERIYRDRAKSLTYVCETPVLLEKRLFALAQILQKFVSD